MSDYQWINRLYLYQTALLVMAVTTTLCPLATSYGGLVVYTILFGIFDGAFVALIAVLTGDIVGGSKLPSALGFLYLVFSVPIMTGSLIAGIFSPSNTDFVPHSWSLRYHVPDFRAAEIEDLTKGKEEKEGHARKVMRF